MLFFTIRRCFLLAIYDESALKATGKEALPGIVKYGQIDRFTDCCLCCLLAITGEALLLAFLPGPRRGGPVVTHPAYCRQFTDRKLHQSGPPGTAAERRAYTKVRAVRHRPGPRLPRRYTALLTLAASYPRARLAETSRINQPTYKTSCGEHIYKVQHVECAHQHSLSPEHTKLQWSISSVWLRFRCSGMYD